MERLTLQFATENSFGSQMIRWFTWSPYSHVDIVLDNGQLLGARFKGGVEIRDPGYARFMATKRLTLSLTQAQKKKFIKAARSQVGTAYDWRAIIAFAFHHRHWETEDAWFCSELVAWCAVQAGIPLLRTTDLNHITPRDLSISPLLSDA